MRTVGTCSQCGGRVCVPDVWLGIYPPEPTCVRCHAVAKGGYGPVIETERSEDFRGFSRESQAEYFGVNKK